MRPGAGPPPGRAVPGGIRTRRGAPVRAVHAEPPASPVDEGSLERDVAVLAAWPRLALGLQRLQSIDDLRPGLVRDDHVVQVATLGGDVWVGEVGLVIGDQLLP